MTNELRKTLGRNMRFAQMNNDIDNQIRQLQTRTSYDVNAQTQIDALKQQKALNEQQMQQPMSEQEYASYDDNGNYIGSNAQQNSVTQQNASRIGQAITDGINHTAQGIALGWSDEAFGAVGGTGRVMANGIRRASGYDVNGESFGDAWNKGYQEYRDFARQELQNGYERNPAISGLAEIGGALVSPIKPFSGMKGAIANGVIGGVGMTDTNNPTEYIVNIGLNTAGSVTGEKVGGILENKTNNFLKDRAKNLSFGLSKSARALTKMGANSLTNQINSWRKDDEW